MGSIAQCKPHKAVKLTSVDLQNKCKSMGNSGSRPKDSLPNGVLVHSFQLEADAECCNVPICCPGKQAMFQTPRNFSSHLSNFIPYEEGVKMIEDINKILRETHFGRPICNPFFIFCMLLSSLLTVLSAGNAIPGMNWDTSYTESNNVLPSTMVLMTCFSLPYIFYFLLMKYKKSQWKSRHLTFLHEWNENKSNGVFLSLEFPKNQSVRGYLHVFVNYRKRENWCQRNGVTFVPPVAPHQQIMEEQIPHHSDIQADPVPVGFQNPSTSTKFQQQTMEQQNQQQDHFPPPPIPAGFQIPAGYALVPQRYPPPQEFQVPAGYAQVPHSQDLPPNYYEASMM